MLPTFLHFASWMKAVCTDLSSAASAITSPVRDRPAVVSWPELLVRLLEAFGIIVKGLTRRGTLALVVLRRCTIVRIMSLRSGSLPALARFAIV